MIFNFFIFLFAVSKILLFFAALKSKRAFLNEKVPDLAEIFPENLADNKNEVFLQSQN